MLTSIADEVIRVVHAMGFTNNRKPDPHKQVEVWFRKVLSDKSNMEEGENEYRHRKRL
jgi:hypothetical protein